MRPTDDCRKMARILILSILVLATAAPALFAFFGYFDRDPIGYEPAEGRHRPDLVAVFLSGDMGLRVGSGRAAIDALRARGIPVLTLAAPGLFGRARNRAYVDRLLDRSIRTALGRSGAHRFALVGSSFGADVVAVAAGSLRPDLKARVASVVLMLPSVPIWFHANPTGIFYRGRPDADAQTTADALAGLPVTCVYAAREDDSLCRMPQMARARHIGIAGGHMMLGQHALFASIAAGAAEHPAEAMQR
jgi:type IV secretory pathway VirJ component